MNFIDPVENKPETEPIDAKPTSPNSARRMAQMLLDPRGLHALMLSGGGMLALGLVIWLAVIGIFENPVVAASGLGLGNIALLGVGLWVTAKSPYKLAGRATAMLACLLLPLNLWFYDAQGLITLKDGGNLWVPALVCCVIYAAIARTMRDSLFVYAFTGGVALTGLLFLADGDVNHFWEVLAPSTLLVTLGIGCIHVPRFFPEESESETDKAFTREDFGLAFFRAGHTLLASGLGLLLAGRLAGRYYTALFQDLGWFVEPDVVAVDQIKLAAIALVLSGAYAYLYSRLVHQGERFTVLATLTVVWAGVIGLELLGVGVVGTLMAVTAAGSVALVLGKTMKLDAVAYSGRAAVALGGAAGGLLACNRILGGEAAWPLLAFTVGQALLSAVAALYSSSKEGRSGFIALTVLLGLSSGAVLNQVSVLHIAQKVELFATFVGVSLLGVGLVGWKRESIDETRQRDSLVDTNLWVGSLLTTGPMTLGLLASRLFRDADWWMATHEIAVLVFGLALVGMGVLARLRSMTLAGTCALTVYLMSLVLLIDVPDQLQNVAVYLMTGGGLVFAAAVLLSVYRDRLLAIPDRVRQGEGVFAVLKWR